MKTDGTVDYVCITYYVRILCNVCYMLHATYYMLHSTYDTQYTVYYIVLRHGPLHLMANLDQALGAITGVFELRFLTWISTHGSTKCHSTSSNFYKNPWTSMNKHWTPATKWIPMLFEITPTDFCCNFKKRSNSSVWADMTSCSSSVKGCSYLQNINAVSYHSDFRSS